MRDLYVRGAVIGVWKDSSGCRILEIQRLAIWSAEGGPLWKHLRTFAPIATAHSYCARKFTRQVMHRARALRNKTNYDREDGHCYSFAWILRSWTFGDSYYSFHKQVLFTMMYTMSKNEQIWASEVKKNQDFCPQDFESCHLATARCVKLWSLQTLRPYQLTMPDFSDLGYFSGHVLSKRKLMTPNTFFFFAFFAIVYHYLSSWQVLKKSVRGNFWARTSLRLRSLGFSGVVEAIPQQVFC